MIRVVTEWDDPEFIRDGSGREMVRVIHPHDGELVWMFSGTPWRTPLTQAELPEEVRIAAERLWWERKTPGPDELRISTGHLMQLRNPGPNSFSFRVCHNGEWAAWERCTLAFGDWTPESFAKIQAWHKANYKPEKSPQIPTRYDGFGRLREAEK
jgi:hypothetical protein